MRSSWVKDTSTQLTSSLVTELRAGAGSTTAAGKTSSRLDELHQEKQLSFDQQSSNTKNSTSSCTAPLKHKKISSKILMMDWSSRPSPGGEGQVISSKSRRRRTSPGAKLGGEGKQGASHHHQQARAADNNTFAAQLQASGRNDHLTAPHC
jgi:hypothetical protein